VVASNAAHSVILGDLSSVAVALLMRRVEAKNLFSIRLAVAGAATQYYYVIPAQAGIHLYLRLNSFRFPLYAIC